MAIKVEGAVPLIRDSEALNVKPPLRKTEPKKEKRKELLVPVKGGQKIKIIYRWMSARELKK